MGSLKNRIKRVEEETSPELQQFEEFKIVNLLPGVLREVSGGKTEITIRSPVKKGRRR